MRTASKRDKQAIARRIGAFLQQYRRRAQKGQEPNDRRYDPKIEQYLRRLKPEEVDALINDRVEDDLHLASHVEMRKHPEAVKEFCEHILLDYEPLFVSDDAKIWDVTLSPPEELIQRCIDHYGIMLTIEDLDQPLWELIRVLDESRGTGNS
jgi:hypothetical protein